MEKPYVAIEDCTDLAYLYLKKANVQIKDQDVESLAESIAGSIVSWLGDMKHLTPAYRPTWGNS